jgi:hypothetical protein
MVGLGKKLVLGSALAASTLVAVTPAEAQRWRGRNRGGGDVAAGAIIGGIVGLGLGAAIANSNNRGWRGRGYDPRWDGRGFDRGWGGPGWNGGGWNGGAWGGPGWNGGGWGGPGWNGYAPRCYIVRDWDPYWGTPVNRRICR